MEENGSLISMDGRGRCKDNIRIERFWRTVKPEYVHINPTDSVVELRQGISDYIEFYSYERPHQSIGEVLPARSTGQLTPPTRINRIKIWTAMKKELIL